MFIHHHCFPMFFLLQHALTVVKSTRISWISQPILLNALQLRRPKQSGITEWFGYSSGSTFGNRPVPFVSDVVIAALLGLKTAGGAIAGKPCPILPERDQRSRETGGPASSGLGWRSSCDNGHQSDWILGKSLQLSEERPADLELIQHVSLDKPNDTNWESFGVV